MKWKALYPGSTVAYREDKAGVLRLKDTNGEDIQELVFFRDGQKALSALLKARLKSKELDEGTLKAVRKKMRRLIEQERTRGVAQSLDGWIKGQLVRLQ